MNVFELRQKKEQLLKEFDHGKQVSTHVVSRRLSIRGDDALRVLNLAAYEGLVVKTSRGRWRMLQGPTNPEDYDTAGVPEIEDAVAI